MGDHRTHEMDPASLRAYREIKESGLLSDQELAVDASFLRCGPMTARENDVQCGIGDRPMARSLQPVINRLEKKRVLRRCDRRSCTITGRRVLVYESTRGLPVEPDEDDEPVVAEPDPETTQQEITEIRHCYAWYRKCRGGRLLALEAACDWDEAQLE